MAIQFTDEVHVRTSIRNINYFFDYPLPFLTGLEVVPPEELLLLLFEDGV